jgi:predicted metalloprotease
MKLPFAATAASVLMGASLMAGCESPPSPTPNTEWQQSFADVTNYWENSRGLGDLGVRLLVLNGDAVYNCGGQNFSSDYKGFAAYCSDKTVLVAEASFSGLVEKFEAQGGKREDAERILLSHEIGHRLQQMLLGKDGAATRTDELRADCLAKEALADIDGGVHAVAADQFYNVMGPGEDNGLSHGTAEERIAAFNISSKDENGYHYGCGLRGYSIFQDGHIEDGI